MKQPQPLSGPTGQRRRGWPAWRLAVIALAVLAILILAESYLAMVGCYLPCTSGRPGHHRAASP